MSGVQTIIQEKRENEYAIAVTPLSDELKSWFAKYNDGEEYADGVKFKYAEEVRKNLGEKYEIVQWINEIGMPYEAVVKVLIVNSIGE